jgi:glycosyltransferase involved in cell wall biosynthesis
MEYPLVSVVISCYNEEKYIAECIKSIQTQDYPNIEIVIVDDASKDKTVQIIQSNISIQDQTLFLKENHGHEYCFNKGLEMARGKYIKVICGDDFLLPESISKSISVLEADSSVSMVTHGTYIVDDQSNKMFKMGFAKNRKKLSATKTLIRTFLSGTNKIGHPGTTTFRKSAINLGLHWDFSIIGAGELDLYVKLLNFGDFYFFPEPLCGFRVSLKSASLIHSNKIANHYLRFVKIILNKRTDIPSYIYPIAFAAAFTKQFLRNMVYIYIRLKTIIRG